MIEVRSNRMPDGGIVTTFTDITPSVEAAEALERANETLERRVRERTEELTRLNSELGRAKAEADEANISKTRFLAAASHDILQPLNAARLYVTSLVERQRGGDDAQLIGNIDASLDAVEEIFGALLDISRLDTGAMKPEIDRASASTSCCASSRSNSRRWRARRASNSTSCPRSLAVRSDRRLLRRLLQNLVSNAIKYTPTGRVLVGCRRRRGKLRIDVYDTGLGIPPAKRSAIFHEFHRLDEGAKVARGLGLGLSIVERIARVLEHKITVALQRRPRLALLRSTCRSRRRCRRAAPARAVRDADRGQLAGIVVLCIDNEPAILDGMETLLGGWGCRVLKAPDLATAAAAIVEAKVLPDGLLVDYHLDQRQRHRRHRRAAPPLRRRPAGDPDHRRPQPARARGSARPWRSGAQQAAASRRRLRALLTQWRVQRVAAAE